MPSTSPFRPIYCCVLMVLTVLSVPAFVLLDEPTTEAQISIRTFVGTFGMGMAAILGPAMIYAGLRTGIKRHVFFGAIGAATLLYWVPFALLK